MRLVIYFLPFLLVVYHCSVAQSSYDDQNAVAIPSANNDFLKSQPDLGIALYTGAPQVNIPIYSLGSKVLTMPITLAYSGASGIKVQDAASFVGLGWHLSAGGNISRVVRGLPDEQPNGYIGTNTAGQKISAGLTNTLVTQIGTGQLDGEPDLFIVTTPFFSFRFVLDQNGNPVFPNNTGFRISHNLYMNANYTNTSWVVTDDNGNQYFFGTTPGSRENMTISLLGTSQNFTSTWNLEKIVVFNSRDVITFSYVVGPDYSVNHYMSSQTTFQNYGNCSGPGTINSNYSVVSTYNAPKYISQISSSLGVVKFNYLFDRQDFANAGRLTSIVVYPYDPATLSITNAIKTFQFNYSYLGAPSTNPDALRLKLDYINLYSGVATDAPLKYKSFDYNITSNLPPRNSTAFDYWGYFNANNTGTALVPTASKIPDPNLSQANILTGIHDLSGEVQQMQYELNTYYSAPTGANVPTGGLRVNEISKTAPSQTPLLTQYFYNDASGRSTGQIYDSTFLNFSKVIGIVITNGQTGCVVAGSTTVSESLYNSYDLDGNFVGYSAVKVVSQNGGYEIDQFTNYSDAPDLFNYANTSGTVYGYNNALQLGMATSYSYKRGLLKCKTIYTAAGDSIGKTQNTYTSLDQPVGKATGVKAVAFTYIAGFGVSAWIYGTYVNNVENYALTQTVQSVYDQSNQALTQQVVSNFTYAANHRLVQRIDYSDSKGLTRNKTFYYTEDVNPPYITGDEQYAINAMLSGNNTNAMIHSVETHNGTSVNTHYSYLDFLDGSLNNKVFLANKKVFAGTSTDGLEEQYQYDLNSANLTAESKLGGPFLSTMYGYNNTYITAKARNALNSSSVAVSEGTQSGDIDFPPNNNGIMNTSFVIDYAGTVTFNITFGMASAPGTLIRTLEYSLVGPSNIYSGTLCNSPNATCSFSPSVTLSGVPPGSYTLTVTPQTSNNIGSADAYFNFTYPKFLATATATNEFYYQGFESSSSAATATPFAGIRYYAGAYTVPFTIPDSRSYQIDYHYLLNGVWYARTRSYTNNMVLSDGSAVDEVRVYPTDAQMITYTYNPLFGITSQCDARNRFTFYEYDDFGRLKRVRDNDGNIVDNYDYQYQVNMGQTCPLPEISSVTSSGLTLTVNYTAPPNSTSCGFSIYDQTTGLTTSTTQSCGTAVTLAIPATTRTYTVTVTSYTPDCPAGVTSYPQFVTVP